MSQSLAGLYPAFLTPLDSQLQLNEPAALAMLDYLLGTGMDGVYVAGSTGEGMRLPVAVRERLVELVRSALPEGKRLLVHVGATQIADALRLTEHAARVGAHAISSLPPAGNAAEVYRFYETLAERSPLPLILYYFPKVAPHAFTEAQQLLDVCDLPNVVGVKFTDFNTHLMQRLVKRGKLVFSGYDEALAAGLLMGAQGGIGSTYNAMPEHYLKLYGDAKAGNWEGVRQRQSAINEVINELIAHPFFPALRAVMREKGFDCGPMMSGETLAPGEAEAMMKVLRDSGENNLCGLRA
jgi:N-acetylneuraminate lyase